MYAVAFIDAGEGKIHDVAVSNGFAFLTSDQDRWPILDVNPSERSRIYGEIDLLPDYEREIDVRDNLLITSESSFRMLRLW